MEYKDKQIHKQYNAGAKKLSKAEKTSAVDMHCVTIHIRHPLPTSNIKQTYCHCYLNSGATCCPIKRIRAENRKSAQTEQKVSDTCIGLVVRPGRD